MKLLLDENLSPRLLEVLARAFPSSKHVEHVGLRGRPDLEVWEFAAREGFVVVSKDHDFRELSFLYGSPPKVIWLGVDDARTSEIAELILESRLRIAAFERDAEESLLALERRPRT